MLRATFLLVVLSGMCVGQDQPANDKQVQAFWQAARQGDVAAVEQLVKDGVPIDAVTEFNCGAVYFAANRNQAKVIRTLAKLGANVNLRDTDYGFTPVQMGAWLGHTDATAALIEAGADRSDASGSAFAAASNGHADTVRMIAVKLELEKGQLTALWNVAQNAGASEVCRVLEELGVTPPKSAGGAREPEPAATPSDTDASFDFESDRAIPVNRAMNWTAFRGASRTGIADGQHPPAAFDLESGRNVRWSVPVPGLGMSSPIVWDGRVYITTAVSSATRQSIEDNGLGWIAAVPEDVPHEWKVMCYDLATGDLVWDRVACEGKPRNRRHWKASQANPTCVTDGRNLVVSFGSEGLYCFDLDGGLRWKTDLGDLNTGWYIDSTFAWGFASSPIIHGDKVILQCDIFDEPFLAAYRLSDGERVWMTKREGELPSWGTPLVVSGQERTELVTNATKAVRGYDPSTGRLLWEIRGNSTITVSSPVAANGLIVATGGYKTPKPIYVVKAGVASGDVTPEAGGGSDSVAWSRQTGGTYIVTPLLYRGLLYMCRQNGVMTVLDPQTGEQKYQQRLRTGPITASPVAADGRLYFVGEDGRVVVIAAGEEFRQIATSRLGAASLCTPAVSDGHIIFRTVKGLVAVAHTKKE